MLCKCGYNLNKWVLWVWATCTKVLWERHFISHWLCQDEYYNTVGINEATVWHVWHIILLGILQFLFAFKAYLVQRRPVTTFREIKKFWKTTLSSMPTYRSYKLTDFQREIAHSSWKQCSSFIVVPYTKFFKFMEFVVDDEHYHLLSCYYLCNYRPSKLCFYGMR